MLLKNHSPVEKFGVANVFDLNARPLAPRKFFRSDYSIRILNGSTAPVPELVPWLHYPVDQYFTPSSTPRWCMIDGKRGGRCRIELDIQLRLALGRKRTD
jgi:hypothetical protein